MSRREAHAVVYHLYHLIETGKATEAQERFFDALVIELERRWHLESSQSRCHCRMCLPAAPMGRARPADELDPDDPF